MDHRFRLVGVVAALGFCTGADLFACGDKFLVGGRGTRYQRPKDARAASVLIYASPDSGLPAALGRVRLESVLKREGHRSTTAETLEQLSALLAGGRFDVILATSTVVSGIQELLLGRGADAPVVVAFCVKSAGTPPPPAVEGAPCTLKTPAKERSLLEEIDKAVERHDRNTRKRQVRG
jgi:hypothetical protein